MKKPSALFPLEQVLFIQRVTATILICLMLLSCFGGLFVVPFNDDFSDFYTAVDEEDLEDFEDGVFIRFDFLGSVFSIFKLIYFANANGPELDRAYHEVTEMTHGHSLSVRSNAIAYLLMEGFDSELTVGIYYSIAVLISISLPLVLLASVIVLLKKYRAPMGKRDEHATFKGVMNIFRIIICRLPLPILLTALAPKVSLGTSMWIILILCGIILSVNLIAPIFKEYTKAQRKYVIMLQAVSFLGIINFAAYCISLIGSNVATKTTVLFEGKSLSGFFSMFGGGRIDMDEVLFSISGMIIFISLLSAHHSLANNLCRIGLTTTRMRRKDYSSGDSYPTTTIAPNVMIFIYLLLLGSKGEFVFYPEEIIYFIALVATAALMLITELGIVFLKETLCVDVGRGGRDTVLEGNTYKAQIEKYDYGNNTDYGKLKILAFFKGKK